MSRTPQSSNLTLIFVLLAALMTAGCAAPQAPSGLNHQIKELLKIQQQQAEQLTQLQQQLESLQGQPKELALTPGQPTVQEIPIDVEKTVPALVPMPSSAEETAEITAAAQLYLEAFAAIATGQMPEAEAGFKTFIQRFPDHEYTGNANYWMAETLFAQQQDERALNILRAIIENPQQQNKAPAAMARLVKYYRANNAEDKADNMLQMLSTKYPESPELKRLMRIYETR